MARLHYRITTLLVLGCCILVTALDWVRRYYLQTIINISKYLNMNVYSKVGNGNRITCVMEGNKDDWTIPQDVGLLCDVEV